MKRILNKAVIEIKYLLMNEFLQVSKMFFVICFAANCHFVRFPNCCFLTALSFVEHQLYHNKKLISGKMNSYEGLGLKKCILPHNHMLVGSCENFILPLKYWIF